MIVKRALALSKEVDLEVVAEDTDNLVMLILYMSTKSGIYDIKNLTPTEKSRILLIHSLTGCDTVSGLFGHGKVKLYKKLSIDNPQLASIFEVLLDIEEIQMYGQVVHNGLLLLQYIYGNTNLTQSLSQLRVHKVL